MAPNDSTHTTDAGRRKAARYVVPVAVASVAAATIGLVPALAASGDPELPKISAQELIEKIAASDVQQLSGTVKISTDLGLPSLAGLGGLAGGGAGSSSSAAPQDKLTELASGTHTLRVAADGPDRQRVALLGEGDEYSLIRNGDEIWAYDSKSNEVYHAKEPAGTDKGDSGKGGKDGNGGAEKELPGKLPSTPKDLADEALKAVDETTSVTVDGTARVAGRDAYQLVIKPKQSGSTIESIKVAVDAEKGVPLKFTVKSTDGGKPVVDAGFTKIDYARPAASTFDFTPPKGAKVTEEDGSKAAREAEKAPEGLAELTGGGLNVLGEGWTTIARIKAPGAEGAAKMPEKGELPPEAGAFLDALGDKVSGKFGSGTVFKTRLVNALLTDDGTVYVGAVTKDALVKAADAAK
ncbi:LolA family protein [Streptomyces purpureus]|uniref:MucB/RseB N-terminal domain-containing protein n=1 Tax=Streptomyces purpureus TaxID=1951 RepID=A0A918H1D9_9ACTN|nr:outer membrane lipoprotein carrier protein LolA [Streptomyces purpureus]GGT31609.1 hypothetical protein GCM10014713_26440 [Streptomyces purpureus]